MINTLLASIGIPILISVVKKGLEHINNPVASAALTALTAVEDAISNNKITKDELSEANRHTEKMQEIEAMLDEATLKQINETFRQEVTSEDSYVRRWRPTFGYAVALTWVMIMSGVAYCIIFTPEFAPSIITSLVNCSALWSVALGVLGISVIKRSQDKIITAGKDLPAKSSFINFNKNK